MKQRDEFDNAGSFITVGQMMGELVLFAPTEHVQEVTTTFGVKDAIITDLVILSAEGQPVYEDVMILQGALIGTLKRRLIETENIEKDPSTGLLFRVTTRSSRAILGVIGKGEAKKGQNAPFELQSATEEQKQIARDFLAGYAFVRPPVVTRELFETHGNTETMPVQSAHAHRVVAAAAEYEQTGHTPHGMVPAPAPQPVAARSTYSDPEDPFAVNPGQ